MSVLDLRTIERKIKTGEVTHKSISSTWIVYLTKVNVTEMKKVHLAAEAKSQDAKA